MDKARNHVILGSVETAIALANTLSGGVDRLRTPADMAEWLDSERKVLGDAPHEIALRVSDFRALRDAVRDLLEAAAAKRALPGGAVQLVNRTSALVPSHLEIDLSDPAGPSITEIATVVNPAARMLAQVAGSAVRVLGTQAAESLRVCPAPRCGRFFLVARPDQVWCSPACGNRARVGRHAARRRDRES
jgi:predicted RNA-binding Zn ribbon-like protein